MRIAQIEARAFRGFRRKTTISLSAADPANLAVFAPNACGKSSIVDAVEFFLSDDGLLERLAKRRSDTAAGREAVRHARAQASDLPPYVEVRFIDKTGAFGDRRECGSDSSPIPPSARRVRDLARVAFIIRGHHLRAFVEGQTSEERYEEFAKWFGFDGLVARQNALRAVRLDMTKAHRMATADARLVDGLKKLTSNAVPTWNDDAALRWYRDSVLTGTLSTVAVGSFVSGDAGRGELERRRDAEGQQTGLAPVERCLATLTKVVPLPDAPCPSVSALRDSFAEVVAARKALDEARAVAATADLEALWREAERVIAVGSPPPDDCPVCTTPFTASPLGTRLAVLDRLRKELGALADYLRRRDEHASAVSRLRKAQADLVTVAGEARATVDAIGSKDLAESIQKPLTTIADASMDGIDEEPSAVEALDSALRQAQAAAFKQCAEMRAQTVRSAAAALRVFDDLVELRLAFAKAARQIGELDRIAKSVLVIEQEYNAKVRDYVSGVIGELQAIANEIFKSINQVTEDAPPIRLELPSGDVANTRKVQLKIDFAPAAEGVPPASYLSDSQVHTLALSLRIAAIVRFNDDFPVIILDDVVTSYDSMHRRRIADALLAFLPGFQVIVVTHDEMFFRQIKEKAPEGKWRFRRIARSKPEADPSFTDDRITNEILEDRWSRGESAANELRRAEEEALLRLSREFGAQVTVRPIDRPYDYERGELASSLAAALRPYLSELGPPFKGEILKSLASMTVENFGSHFQDNPAGFGSIGDERARWEEFRELLDQFKCWKCGGREFEKHPRASHAVCASRSCGERFHFRAPTPATHPAVGQKTKGTKRSKSSTPQMWLPGAEPPAS